MKKVLLMLSLIAISNIFAWNSGKWVHLANDTSYKIKVTGKNGINQIVFQEIAEPFNVKFIPIQERDISMNLRNISAVNLNPIIGADGKAGYIEKTLVPQKTVFHLAFHIKPLSTTTKGDFEIKQRTQSDAKQIIEKHQLPANPQYLN